MTRKPDLEQIRAWFYCGKYQDVLLGADGVGSAGAELWALRIGALVFTGEVSEARHVLQRGLDRRSAALAPEFVAQARFFLGVGLVRLSRYDEASSAFRANLVLLRDSRMKSKRRSARLEYFCWQGSAFYRFFAGRFAKSRSRARKAYLASRESGFAYGQVLSLDLMGHCDCLMGEVRTGISELERALALSQGLGNGGIETALRVSIVKCRAQFGLDLKGAEVRLRTASRKLAPEDTYSRGELYLELARQLVLRGKASEAQRLLDENCDFIYRHQNRRQSATYHLRYSYILHMKGESHAALTLLRSARANLVEGMDPMYRRQLDGLERKIQLELGGDTRRSPEGAPVSALDSRILARSGSAAESAGMSALGQDPIGDWIDRARSRDPGLVPELAEAGLFGLLPGLLGFRPWESAIVLGPGRGECLAFSKGDVHREAGGLTSSMRRLLLALSSSGDSAVKSKESLVIRVWGYRYRPEIHDALLHATIGKLRKLLGDFGGWVEWSEGGYRLSPSVRVREAGVVLAPAESAPPASLGPRSLATGIIKSELLNYRQLQALRLIEQGNYIGVAEHARRFRVSHMTACRDLTSLARSNKVARIGKARATRYGLT